ncbi:50S ribosomal protein L32e [Candidatus Micrarchaeota archaeon]|nr:50S ribosomal protein L32e [Candidatus Micrarchaeota archaeon]
MIMIKKWKPRFRRQHKLPHSRVGKAWRKPRGTYSKQAHKKKFKGARPEPGYGQPRSVRGLHPSGLAERLVHNTADITALDPKKHCARIASGVGLRKRKLITESAAKLQIRVLNSVRSWHIAARKPAQKPPATEAKPAEAAKPAVDEKK